MNINWDSFKVRCSGINKALSKSKSNPNLTDLQEATLIDLEYKLQTDGELTKKEHIMLAKLQTKRDNDDKTALSDTCIDYLMEEYGMTVEGMISIGKESMSNIGIEKGNLCEMEALNLLIRVDKVPYKRHKERIYNDYLSGEIDAYHGGHVMSAERILDLKNVQDYILFLRRLHKGIEKEHRQQVQGYMDITKAPQGQVSYALVDMPDVLQERLLWVITSKLGAATPESPEVLAEWPLWVKSMHFAHIPPERRVYSIPVHPFSHKEQQALYDRVKVIREWLFRFHENYQKTDKYYNAWSKDSVESVSLIS